MSSTIIVPKEFSYVLASLVSTSFLTLWQTATVGRYRKASGIKYPQMYAEVAETKASVDALKFNCAQRAHQNTLEVLPGVLLSTVVFGLKYPVLAASGCGLWVLSRIMYTMGYVSGDPKKRSSRGGAFGNLLAPLLYLGSAWASYEFVSGGL